MKRNLQVENVRESKRVKLQQTLTSMFKVEGPKFVEACGVQLVCPYCQRKFKAPQGLVSHKHMHERAGDTIHPKPKRVIQFKRQMTSPRQEAAIIKPRIAITLPPRRMEKESKDVAKSIETIPQNRVAGKPVHLMSRRFTVAEKLEIIDEFKKSQNLSATCR